MKPNEPIRHQPGAASIRLFHALTVVILVSLLLAFWNIQVAGNEGFLEQANDNRIKSLRITAPRGAILDRHGRAIADSRLALTALLDATRTSPEQLDRIAAGLDLDPEEIRARLSDASDFGLREHIILKEDLSIADLAFLEGQRPALGQLDLVQSMRRKYPVDQVAVHTIGYVGKASKQELGMREFLLYEFGADIGKSGIERQYDHWLNGTNGHYEYLVDSLGRRLATVGVVDSVPGNDLRLTIDLELQAVSELGLEGRRGAVVALDPRNGEVLAMASAPAFDPNHFVTGFKGSQWSDLHRDPDTPLLNRAVQGTWAMGSVFKPIVALAGLEKGIAGSDFTAYCTGGLSFGGHYFRCHRRGGHGRMDLTSAIAQSCDVYFYLLGTELGIDTLAAYARRAGLGAKTGIDLPDEVSGLMPSVAWKVRRSLQPWFPGETVVVSIGQGAMSVTPIQAAHSIGGLAMGGVWHRPHLVPHDQRLEIDPQNHPYPPRTKPVSPAHLDVIRTAMWEVVNGAGTGREAGLRNIPVCGKTGTSQRVSNETRLKSGRADFEDDAWFVGFAPCEDPEIVVAVLLENGKASYYAAAVARDVLQVWLLNRSMESEPAAEPQLARLAEVIQ